MSKQNYLMIKGKKIQLSQETVDNFMAGLEEPIIKVPSSIKIGLDLSDLILMFNNNQGLTINVDKTFWIVMGIEDFNPIACKLIPYDRGNLVAGDIAFCSMDSNTNFLHLEQYCLILGNSNIIHTRDSGGELKISHDSWAYWWKVEQL